MPGEQFREVPAHEASQTVVDQPQTLRYGLQVLVRRFVQAYRLGVFLHAAPRYGTSTGRFGYLLLVMVRFYSNVVPGLPGLGSPAIKPRAL